MRQIALGGAGTAIAGGDEADDESVEGGGQIAHDRFTVPGV